MHDRQRALSALHAIDPGSNRETWIKIGMAAKDAGLSVEDFIEWSTPAHNFGGDKDCAMVWRSFHNGGITERTLFKFAVEAGWKEPSGIRRDVQRRTILVGEDYQAPTTTSPQTAFNALWSQWEACIPATAEQPYITAKRGTAEGLRTVPTDSDWSIASNSVAGWLVVPAITLDGELCTVQFIPPPGIGKKLNAPGASFGDGVFIVGNADNSKLLYVCEGIGQAWACASATGCAAVVAFGAGRLTQVCKALRSRFNGKPLVVVADRGKEELAMEIAKVVRSGHVEMPQDKPANYDANDYAAEYGMDSLAKLLAAAEISGLRYRVLESVDVLNAPPLQWLVRNVLPQEGQACVYGAPGSGKSFLTLDLCVAVASGTDWFGYRVTQAPVVYVALEGEAGFRQRIKAWQIKHCREIPSALRFVMQSFSLREPQDISDLAEAIAASGVVGGLLVIDTLNRAASGADENSSRDMGELIDAAKALQKIFGGLVLLVHHSGKDPSKGPRGHSSLNGALESVIEVRRYDNRRSWGVPKIKDGNDNAEHQFRLEVVSIGEHEDGEPITSCVVVPDNGRIELRRAIPPKGGNQRMAFQAITELVQATGIERPHDAPASAPPGAAVIPIVKAQEAIGRRLLCDDKRRTERAQQALMGLQAKNLVTIEKGYLWMR